MSAVSDFFDLLVAAMADAADEGKLCQLQTEIVPPSGKRKTIRIIVVPEEMDFVRSDPTGKLKRPA